MTSGSGVDAVLRELHFGAASGGPADPACAETVRFRFTTDFGSAERWPDVPYDTTAPSARPTEAQRARIGSVLDAAARTMARRVPAALRLVDGQLERVLLRTDGQAAGGSASHRAHVGRCLLTNLHQPADAPLVAIEAVTHEAIHQLMYRTEAARGLFCDLDAAPTFRSPWTGARLPLHSLVHACVVWFGLLALWSELALTATTDTESAHARGRIAHCLFGFAFLDDTLAGPASPAARIDAAVLEALHAMSATARRATRAAEPHKTLRDVAAARDSAAWPATVAAVLSAAATR